jgi:hypothetical protein
MKTLFKIALSSIFLTSSFTGFSQGKIDKSKADLTSKREQSGNRRSGSNASLSELDYELAAEMARLFLFVTYYAVIGDYKRESHLKKNLTEYPYYKHSSGNYENRDSLVHYNRGRLDMENLFLFSQNDFFGNHFKAKIRPFQYFYFQTDYFQLVEFSKMEKINSNLSLFNFNLCYDRLRFERFNLGYTLGLNYIANDVQKVGFSYGLNTDIFLVRNISLNGSAKWSSINGYPVNQFEAHLKHHLKKWYISLGFEHLKIATPTYNFASVGVGIFL